MNDSETRINRDEVIATAALKGKRGNVRRSLVSWRSALEDARRSVVEGTTTEVQVRALVRQGCRLAGAVPSQRVGHDGDQPVRITTGEDMARDVAIVRQLGHLLRTQIDGADASP